jgi:D-alanine-D-alanine ligase
MPRAGRGKLPRRIALLLSDDTALAHGADDDARAVLGVREVSDRIESACLALGWSVTRVGVSRDPRRLLADLERAQPDVAFHLAESVGGDARLEAAVAMLLEWIGLPYTGSPPQALAQALEKPVARALLAARGVPIARGAVLARGDEPLAGLSPPWIVKPSREDASHGIHLESVVSDEASLRRAARRLIEHYRQPALVEEFLDGRELQVSLLGPTRAPRVLPIFEIEFDNFPAGLPRVVTYAAKWHKGSDEWEGLEEEPAKLDHGLAARVQEVACSAYQTLGLRGYGRVDLRLAGDGRLIVVDVNPNPDLGEAEVLARSAACAGIDYTSLIETVVGQALGGPGASGGSRSA